MKSLYSKTGRRETVRLVNSTYPATRKIKEKFICGLRGACRSLYRWRASVMPPKQNERREVRTFTKKQSKRCFQTTSIRSHAESSNSATGSRVFLCVRPPCVPCPVRAAVDDQLLRDAAAARTDPSLFFISSFSSSSSLQSRQQGLRTP